MRKFLLALTKIVFRIFFKVEVINQHKVPQDGPALLCASHNTMIDMFFLGFKLKRWVYWMAKEELFRNPLLAFVLRKLGAFPVRRGTADISSIKHAYKLLKENKIVGIFPQGTRAKTANREYPAKSGAVLIAANAGVPVIPAAVFGTYRLFSRMKVVYGDPYYIEKNGDKLSKEYLSEMSRDMIDRIYALAEVR
ncbi:MAG TPA: lysophospholipid acyltransferase family protein [Clostridiales bacterium]|nr:lysophospholipid acyltransferase family protein [Clostridiales bacterium]HPV01961.1 lysophospholipid acyltransferase family protein [Clostridiales bacterium]